MARNPSDNRNPTIDEGFRLGRDTVIQWLVAFALKDEPDDAGARWRDFLCEKVRALGHDDLATQAACAQIARLIGGESEVGVPDRDE